MISLLIVGLSTNFWVALLGRCIGGFLNGNVGELHILAPIIPVQADFNQVSFKPWWAKSLSIPNTSLEHMR